MSVYNTLASVVREPASQAFVETTADPPFLYELTVGDVQVRIVRPAGAEGTLPVGVVLGRVGARCRAAFRALRLTAARLRAAGVAVTTDALHTT